MSDFYKGDLAFYHHISGPPPIQVEIIGCEENTGPHSMCRIRLLEARNTELFPLALDSEMNVPRFFLQHYQKPLKNVFANKARKEAFRTLFEKRTGQYGGPGGVADDVRAFLGDKYPKRAEGPWSNGRKGKWIKNPLSSEERRRDWKYVPYGGGTRKRKSKGRKTRRGRR